MEDHHKLCPPQEVPGRRNIKFSQPLALLPRYFGQQVANALASADWKDDMTKTNLDRVLENAVARAIGVKAPHKAVRLIVPAPRHDVKHAA
jgi:hypothetical protein